MQTMADRDGVIWFDGEMVDWRDAKIHVLTHTLHYGMGVFEGLRAYKAEQGTAIFRLQAHTDRLFESAELMNMTIPFDKDTLNKAQLAAVADNNLQSAYVRPMCFYGSEGMGLRADNLRVHVMIAAWEWGAYLGQESLDNGIRIRKSSYIKNDSHPSMYLAKANGNYINSMLALDEAMSKGYDEALLLDSKGNVAEGSGENIFMVNDGVLYTPELTASLNGITRNTIMTLAKETGYDVVETTIKLEQLYVADEVFFTGSAAEVTPIREIDDHVIGNGSRGPITEKLQTMYFDLVHGRLDTHSDWLSQVR
ncbi:MAG: branched chain amino acid aminotransferase [Gammaproteobacteria bacterium]|nr:MAG: branched chain amino acid aminotransferase [Gammaproteobacteria bacterium]